MKSALPVVVVGGGFAGLAAASALAEAGIRVHLFEARPTLGGRANTFRDPVTGERIDNGQHVLAGCYGETLRLLRRLGSAHLLHRPSTLRVPMIEETGQQTELVLPALPAPVDLAAAVFAWDALTLADRWSVVRIARALRGREHADSVETVREWLQRHGQSERLCRLLWEPLALAALNQSIDQASAASFVAVTSRMFSGEPDAATLLLPAAPLDELYVLPALAFLRERGAAVTTKAQVGVVCRDDRVAAVSCGAELIEAGAIVAAVPWFAFSDLFASVPAKLHTLMSNAAAMRSLPIVTVNLWFDGYAPKEPFVGLPGRTFQWAFAREPLVGSAQSHLSLVSSGAQAICSAGNPELIDCALNELRDAIPALHQHSLRHALVVRERRATFSLGPAAPPRPPTVTAIAGLVLAGDWIDTGLPATIESAVLSGHRAAAAVLARLDS